MPLRDHPEWDAFRAAIVADPDDDTVRLAAADWLDEHGDADRAAFIRVQVELAALEARGEGKSLAADDLRNKEKMFLGPLYVERRFWAAADCPQLVRMQAADRGRLAFDVTGEDRVVFRRGFVEQVLVPVAEWLHHGVAVRARNPVRAVLLEGCDRVTRDQWYEMMPALRGLRELDLVGATGSMHEWLGQCLPGTDVEAFS